MKKVNKSEALESFKEYVKANPDNTWKNFQDECDETYKLIVKQIKEDQGGLCCYCETNFYEKGFDVKDDFRVEHFHPKSDSHATKNWHLDWNNLLGCCHGGSEEYLHGKVKFIKNHKHRHSDILKGENNWDNEILNPLTEIPAFPPYFNVDNDGTMHVIDENCGALVTKAKNCLDSKKLNLNTKKLIDFRKFVIDNLREELGKLIESGNSIDEAVNILLNTHLTKTHNVYPAFFTTIRSYFKKDAEHFLEKQGFCG